MKIDLRLKPTTSLLLCLFALTAIARAEVRVPRIFSDGMVLQRDKPARVWGWGDKGEMIAVELGGQRKTTKVDDTGRWLLTLDPMPVNAKPQELVIKGKSDSVILKNVVIGDVWLCSGQSNMEAAAGVIVDSDLDIPRANFPNIRCLTIPLSSSPKPLDNFPIEERNPYYVELKGVWRTCTPENTRDFPAIGYHFARIVHETTGVPISLIDNSWGGSVVETWVSRETLETIPEASELIESWEREGDRILLSFTAGSYPSSTYGVRVAPTGFVIAGADRHFYPATVVQADGGRFAASSELVKEPVAVRYAWGVHPIANFGNRAGPAVPFRTDNWAAWNDYPIITPVVANPEVSTLDQAKRQAWERKAAQARRVLEQYEAWRATQKPK